MPICLYQGQKSKELKKISLVLNFNAKKIASQNLILNKFRTSKEKKTPYKQFKLKTII